MQMTITGKLVLDNGEEIHISVEGEYVQYQTGPADAYVNARKTLTPKKEEQT